MNKTIMFLGMLVVGFANAQQTNNYDGKVGINTEEPSATLNVVSLENKKGTKALEVENSDNKKILTVANDKKVGINNDKPEYLLDMVSAEDSNIGNAIRIQSFRNGVYAPNLMISRARGEFGAPQPVQKNDNLGVINFSGYTTGNKYVSGFNILSTVAEDVLDNRLRSRLDFMIPHHSANYPVQALTVLYNKNIGIGTATPQAPLHFFTWDTEYHNWTEKEREGKKTMMLIELLGGFNADANKNETKKSIAAGTRTIWNMPHHRSHSIDFGLIGIASATRPFMAFSVAPYHGVAKNEDLTVEHMRIMYTGNIGMGTTNPTNKLHIVATENPLKLEGLQQAGVGAQNLVVEDGVVKIGTGNSATNIVTRDGAPTCSGADDAGKINFGEITLNGKKTEAFGFCMKNGTTGNYGWFYIHGAASTTTGSGGAFGNGLQ